MFLIVLNYSGQSKVASSSSISLFSYTIGGFDKMDETTFFTISELNIAFGC